MTAPSQLQSETVSYSARSCSRCSAPMNRARSALGGPIWACPSCGKREK